MCDEIWKEVQDTLKPHSTYLTLQLSLSRLERTDSGGYRVVTKNAIVYDHLKPDFEVVAEAVQEASGTTDEVEFTFDKPASAQPSLFSKPPADDAQGSLFVPEVSELAIKDDVHLMEIAPWTSTPQMDWAQDTKRTRLVYSVEDMTIEVRSSPTSGLPSHTDYDIVLLMQSWLAQEANAYRKAKASYSGSGYSGEAPKPPARRFKVHKKDILKFARHGDGGKQYARLEEMLERLKETTIYIEQTGQKRRRRGSFSLIADWQTISKSDSGEILAVEIAIPEWVYQGIVEANHPTVLTYSRDYFLLKKPLGRVIYRLARLNHAKGEAVYEFSEVHHRSGSRATLKEFNRALKNFVHSIAPKTFPDYELEITGEDRKRQLTIRPRAKKTTDG